MEAGNRATTTLCSLSVDFSESNKKIDDGFVVKKTKRKRRALLLMPISKAEAVPF